MGTKTLMTVDQFLQLPDEELRRHELWQGELVDLGETIFNHYWIRDMIRCGVLVAWVVDRDPFEIHVFEKGKAKRVVRPGETLEAPTVLPSFSENASRFVPPA